MIWLKRVAVVLAALTGLVVVIGFLLPASVHVERSVVITVPQQQVFDAVNGFESFNEWSPWATLDPNTRYEFSGPRVGVGARMSWASDDPAVGVGSQEIIESTEPTLVRVVLKFDGQDDALSFHRLEALEAGTKVTWGFDAEFGNNLIGRWFGALMFDSMIGADYQKGLDKLKILLETRPQNDTPPPSSAAEPVPQPAVDQTSD